MNEPKVYISYSPDDVEWVRQFAEALRKQDVDVWLDVWKIRPGERWEEKIEAGLRNSDAIVSILTPANAESPWFYANLGIAIGMGKPLIPVVSTDLDSAALPPPVKSRRYVMQGAPDEAAREVAEAVKAKAA
jgi:hypothetical protein